jgi:hypothetical protein
VEGRGNNVEGDDEFRARSHGGHTTMSKLLKRYLYYYYYERRAPYPLSPPAKSPEERKGGARGGVAAVPGCKAGLARFGFLPREGSPPKITTL